MDEAWDVRAAADAVLAAVAAQPGTAAVLTFDRRGVTGHPNHAAAAAAVDAVAPRLAARGLAVWHLCSLAWPLAWLGPAAGWVVPAVVRGGGGGGGGSAVAVVASPALGGPSAVLAGLAAHASQRTWWRVVGAVLRSASYVSVVDGYAARAPVL
jgi:LmbE family N-acetylglucosaminyl deacetylase